MSSIGAGMAKCFHRELTYPKGSSRSQSRIDCQIERQSHHSDIAQPNGHCRLKGEGDRNPLIAKGEMPTDATLYLCAQDHGHKAADALQRFEIIMNGPPVPRDAHKEKPPCQTQIFARLQQFGLTFGPAVYQDF